MDLELELAICASHIFAWWSDNGCVFLTVQAYTSRVFVFLSGLVCVLHLCDSERFSEMHSAFLFMMHQLFIGEIFVYVLSVGSASEIASRCLYALCFIIGFRVAP